MSSPNTDAQMTGRLYLVVRGIQGLLLVLVGTAGLVVSILALVVPTSAFTPVARSTQQQQQQQRRRRSLPPSKTQSLSSYDSSRTDNGSLPELTLSPGDTDDDISEILPYEQQRYSLPSPSTSKRSSSPPSSAASASPSDATLVSRTNLKHVNLLEDPASTIQTDDGAHSGKESSRSSFDNVRSALHLPKLALCPKEAKARRLQNLSRETSPSGDEYAASLPFPKAQERPKAVRRLSTKLFSPSRSNTKSSRRRSSTTATSPPAQEGDDMAYLSPPTSPNPNALPVASAQTPLTPPANRTRQQGAVASFAKVFGSPKSKGVNNKVKPGFGRRSVSEYLAPGSSVEITEELAPVYKYGIHNRHRTMSILKHERERLLSLQESDLPSTISKPRLPMELGA